MANLRDRAVNSLNKMLTLSNSRDGSNEEFSDQWKVLIYDEDCRDIISPVMNVGALRLKGVTLHLLIHSEREAVPDAPAVYFVRPTEANIKRIVEDCSKQLYRNVYLNFVTRIERPLLERLAQDLVTANAVSMITKITDQYLDVVALEQTLFTLNIPDSFIGYNDPGLSEVQIRQYMQRMSMGLLSMIRILGSLPVIRSPTGGAAEMLARNLFSVLKENIAPRGPAHSLFADSLISDRPRPLLLIFDRNSDLFPLLQHSASYQGLVDDLLDHRLNRVTIDASSKEVKAKKKTYDLNTQADTFYNKYSSAPFPEAIEANEKELTEVSEKESEIRSKPGLYDHSANAFDAVSSGKDLSEAIESLPDILNRKANLEAHTNILQAVMKRIAAREVPTYFEVEQSILTTGRVVDKASVITLLKDGSKGKLYDKARLLLLVIVSGDSSITSKSIQDEFDQAFILGCNSIPNSDSASQQPVKPDGGVVTKEEIDSVLAAAAFLRRLQALQTPLSQRFGGTSGSNMGSTAIISSLLTTAQSKATSLMAKATNFFTKFNPMYITRIVDNLAEGRACPEDESFLTLDPKQVDSATGQISSAAGTKYSEVIVFVVGGGCYSEYFNLLELLKVKSTISVGVLKHIIYGCSELTSGDKFLLQLQKLAAKK